MKATASIRTSGFIAAAPEDVIGKIKNPATWPDWAPEILRATGPTELAPGDVVNGEAQMLGFEVDGRATVLDTSPTTLRHEVVVGVKMEVTYRIVPTEGGSVLHHEMTTHLPGGILGRPLSFFLRRRLKKMQRALIDGLDVVTHPAPTSVSTERLPGAISR